MKKTRIKRQVTPNPTSDIKYRVLTLIGLGIVLLLTKSKADVKGIEQVIDAAPVYEGETVSADSYRRTQDQRPGMMYIPCNGALGSRLTFSVPKTGIFTRNVIVVNGIVYAEITRSS